MEIIVLFIILGIVSVVDHNIGQKTNIKNYFDKPYCEEVKLGASKVKKCWKVVEVKE